MEKAQQHLKDEHDNGNNNNKGKINLPFFIWRNESEGVELKKSLRAGWLGYRRAPAKAGGEKRKWVAGKNLFLISRISLRKVSTLRPLKLKAQNLHLLFMKLRDFPSLLSFTLHRSMLSDYLLLHSCEKGFRSDDCNWNTKNSDLIREAAIVDNRITTGVHSKSAWVASIKCFLKTFLGWWSPNCQTTDKSPRFVSDLRRGL